MPITLTVAGATCCTEPGRRGVQFPSARAWLVHRLHTTHRTEYHVKSTIIIGVPKHSHQFARCHFDLLVNTVGAITRAVNCCNRIVPPEKLSQTRPVGNESCIQTVCFSSRGD